MRHVRSSFCHVRSFVAARGLQSTGSVVVARGLSCSAACGILVPRPGIEPVSPALQGRFLTTGPPGKPPCQLTIDGSMYNQFPVFLAALGICTTLGMSVPFVHPRHPACFGIANNTLFNKSLLNTYGLKWRRQWHPTPVLLPGKSHGWRSLVGCNPWGR